MSQKTEGRNIVLVIHNVRSAYNVGALFRTADGAGVKKIFLSGYTLSPDKNDKKYRTKAEKELAKTALGAEMTIHWERVKSFASLVKKLHQEYFDVVALEQHTTSIDYRQYQTEKNIALVVGNEVKGIDTSILDQCDAIIDLPMRGKKNSLNVSVAGGIVLYFLASIL